MAADYRWIERLLRAANQAAPNGIAALALVFGILMVVLSLVVLLR